MHFSEVYVSLRAWETLKVSAYRGLHIVSGQPVLTVSLHKWGKGLISHLEVILAPWGHLVSETIPVAINTTVSLH